jgi:UPF0176 protein
MGRSDRYKRAEIAQPEQKCVVATFYHFTDFPDCQDMRSPLETFCNHHNLKGTILLASEGINSTVAGDRAGIDALLDRLRKDPRLDGLEHKESFCNEIPFQRMKVHLKKEIIKLGIAGIDPKRQAGTYVAPKDWNALIADPTVVVIDTRNRYEVELGTFRHAIDPNLDFFSEFPQFIQENLNPDFDQKIAMFCTGGIRCEKASAYMRSQGFQEVYHLKGGILKYLEETAPAESLWQGECYVFDDRNSVDLNLHQGVTGQRNK